MTKQELVQMIVAAKALWPGWASAPRTPEELEVYLIAWQSQVGDLSYDVTMAAMEKLASDGREFVPPPGVLRQAAIELADRREGRALPTFDEAWGEVIGAVSGRGWFAGPPEWSHPTVASAAAAIGWLSLCSSTNPDTTRAHFMKLFAEARDRWRSDGAMTPAVAAAANVLPMQLRSVN